MVPDMGGPERGPGATREVGAESPDSLVDVELRGQSAY